MDRDEEWEVPGCAQKICIDQRTTRRAITRPFDECLQAKSEGAWKGSYQVSHGVPHYMEYIYIYMPGDQNIDTELTAWRWQLVTGQWRCAFV
jgi:hypothetical protein